MSNNVRKFFLGKKYNNMNYKGLLVLLFLAFPSFLMDIVVICLYSTGKPWIEFTTNIGVGPLVGLWAIPCALASGTMSTLLFISIWNVRNPRIAQNDDPTREL